MYKITKIFIFHLIREKQILMCENDEEIELIAALHDEDKDVRIEAIKTLGKLGEKQVIEYDFGLHMMADEAVYTLNQLGEEQALETVLGAMHDEDYRVRLFVAWVLGMLRNKQAVDPLLKLLNDEDEGVRENAAWALGKLGDKRAVEPLLNSLYEVGEEAVYALGELRDKRAVEPLIQLLRDVEDYVKITTDWNLMDDTFLDNDLFLEELIISLILVLGHLGDTRAIEPLRQLRDQKEISLDISILQAIEDSLTKLEGKNELLKK